MMTRKEQDSQDEQNRSGMAGGQQGERLKMGLYISSRLLEIQPEAWEKNCYWMYGLGWNYERNESPSLENYT